MAAPKEIPVMAKKRHVSTSPIRIYYGRKRKKKKARRKRKKEKREKSQSILTSLIQTEE
jgi:hypothetical protein